MEEYISENTGIWSLLAAEKNHYFDEPLCEAIFEMYNPKKVADVGCGMGQYCKYFKENGWRTVHGYEGTRDIYQIGEYGDIRIIDLSKVQFVAINYDLVVCLEVGEHIPKLYEQIFIDNICRFTSKDLVLSWCIPIPGNKNVSHVNEQQNSYVIDKFIKKGLEFDLLKSDILRKASTLWWFKSTIMVFRRIS